MANPVPFFTDEERRDPSVLTADMRVDRDEHGERNLSVQVRNFESTFVVTQNTKTSTSTV